VKLEQILENTSRPWNITIIEKFEESFTAETFSISILVRVLNNILTIKSLLKTEYEVDYIPEDILEYSSFLWYDLSSKMPCYEDFQKSSFEDVLKKHGINAPSKQQLKWTFDNWLMADLNSKLSILLDHLNNNLKEDQEIKNQILTVFNKHLSSKNIVEDHKLLFFIKNIAPQRAKVLMNKIISEGKYQNTIAVEILEELSKEENKF